MRSALDLHMHEHLCVHGPPHALHTCTHTCLHQEWEMGWGQLGLLVKCAGSGGQKKPVLGDRPGQWAALAAQAGWRRAESSL